METGRGPPCVLVVDDQPLNLELARAVLELDGMTVRLAPDGAQALDSVRQARPDLVLLDMQMPGIDGLTVLRRWRDDPATATLPVVAFTAYAMDGDEQRFIAAGCDGYIAKPLDVKSFAARVRGYLRG